MSRKKSKSTLERVTEPVADAAKAVGRAVAGRAEKLKEAGAHAIESITGSSKAKGRKTAKKQAAKEAAPKAKATANAKAKPAPRAKAAPSKAAAKTAKSAQAGKRVAPKKGR